MAASEGVAAKILKDAFVETVMVPVFSPANTVMDESETTNSSVIVAVPEIVNGI